VEQLLSEDVEDARRREEQAVDAFVSGSTQIVLFGAGGLGRKCLQGLRKNGIEPIAFADNNPAIWNKEVEGVAVFSPSEAARRFGKIATFVITIWGALANDRMGDREAQLRKLGCEKVVPFAPLFWKYQGHVLPHYGADLPHRVLEDRDRVLEAFALWADNESRTEYIAQLKWRLFFDFTSLGEPSKSDIYFPADLVSLGSDEIFVDCGAFDGDSIALFLQKAGNVFRRIHAYEPDPANFRKLHDRTASLPETVRSRIVIKRAAVSWQEGQIRFTAQSGPSSFVGNGSDTVDAVTLDHDLPHAPTFIKMDIEGAEIDALKGASRHIRENTPILAISCYHRQDDLWSIPLLIRDLSPSYKFYLRPHDLEMWDLVCYAIPRSRPGNPSHPAKI
jgi:FkbM family methyltransferase